jgi:hypothetical protein
MEIIFWAFQVDLALKNPNLAQINTFGSIQIQINRWVAFGKLKYPLPVLRIRDVFPGARILIFIHLGSRI